MKVQITYIVSKLIDARGANRNMSRLFVSVGRGLDIDEDMVVKGS